MSVMVTSLERRFTSTTTCGVAGAAGVALGCCARTGRETAASRSQPRNPPRVLPVLPVLAERKGGRETMLFLLADPGSQPRRGRRGAIGYHEAASSGQHRITHL